MMGYTSTQRKPPAAIAGRPIKLFLEWLWGEY